LLEASKCLRAAEAIALDTGAETIATGMRDADSGCQVFENTLQQDLSRETAGGSAKNRNSFMMCAPLDLFLDMVGLRGTNSGRTTIQNQPRR
jgi:hypothetical protein